MKNRLTIAALLGALLWPSVSLALTDGIDLHASHGPGPGSVALSWTGGAVPFDVHRAAGALTLLDPVHKIGTTGTNEWADTPPPGGITFYEVTSPSLGPFVQSITPAGSHFGDIVTIHGSGFGDDPDAVHVRFRYSEGGETLVASQPVFTAEGTRLTVMVPMAIPSRVNHVQVTVGAATSDEVDDFVGALPDDPTPAVRGNEILGFVDDLDLYVDRLDAKLEPWFVETATADQVQVDALHASVGQMRAALLALRDAIGARTAEDRAILDVLAAAPGFGVVRAKLQQAVAALHVSPPGTVLCEGHGIAAVVLDVQDSVDLAAEALDSVIDALDTVCAGPVLLALVTSGAPTPISAGACTTAGLTDSFFRPIVDAIGSIGEAVRRISRAAPFDPTGPYRVAYAHPLWGPSPPVVYVEGSMDVTARPSHDFHNAACETDGCVEDFDVSLFGVDIPVAFRVPPATVPELPLPCSSIAFPPGPGGAAGYIAHTQTDEAACTFTGADVNGPAWDRGLYQVSVSSTCSDLTFTGTHEFELVSGPRLLAITPGSGRIGSSVEVIGQYLPAEAGASVAGAAADFGDVTAPMTSTAADLYTFEVPDTANASGTVSLRVQGRDSEESLPFTVLPPTLDSVIVDPGFEGDEIELHGSGFARNAANNTVCLGGTGVSCAGGTLLPVARVTPYGLDFTVPAGAASGLLQLTAVGVHQSDTLPFDVAHWGAITTLSHPERNAYHPVLAVGPDGAEGIAWIDRHADGGAAHLLFTDASPVETVFREPVEVTSDLAGMPSAPQKPDLAIGPDGRFHVAWVDAAGALRLASFPPGGPPPAEGVLVASPPAGTVFRDPAVAVMDGGDVHVSATRVWTDGDYRGALSHAVSHDGGSTFEPFADFAGPGLGAPNDSLHLGHVDLTFAAGRLWRAWNGFDAACDPGHGKMSIQEVFTQSSADGVTWTAPEAAGACTVDQEHTSVPSSERRAPSVSGDGAGAVVAWDAPMTRGHSAEPDAQVYASRKVAVNVEPYADAGVATVTPAAPGYQNDGGRPSLVHYDQGGAVTTLAWIQRAPGTSPDLVEGVPRLQLNRFTSRLFHLVRPVSQTPTVAPSDTTTIDAQPSLGVDVAGHLHLAWLQGPEGHRVVRVMTTAPFSHADAPATNPPRVPAPDRHLIAANMGLNVADGALVPFWGVLLIDPDFPAEVRWVGTATIGHSGGAQGAPSFTPDGRSLVYHGHGNFYGAALSDLGDETRLLASDHPATGDYLANFAFPIAAADGTFLGISPFEAAPGSGLVVGGAMKNAAGVSHFDRVPDIDVFPSFQNILPSRTASHLAFRDFDYLLKVDELATGTIQAPPSDGGIQAMAWSPVDDKLAYVVFYGDSCPSEESVICASVYEWDTVTQTTVTRASALVMNGDLAYKPDGSDIAFACNGLDCCSSVGAWNICTASGLSVPPAAGMSDSDPVWSPEGTAIVFLRSDPTMSGSVAQLMLWRVGDADVTPLTGPFLGLGHGATSFTDVDWKTIPQ